jgi:hypothetical protein
MLKQPSAVEVGIPRFVEDKDVVQVDLLGHETIDQQKGKNGCLKVKVSVE